MLISCKGEAGAIEGRNYKITTSNSKQKASGMEL